MKYRKKPVVIDAQHWDGTAAGATPIIDWILTGNQTARYREASFVEPGNDELQYPAVIAINTLEGVMNATAGDYVIRGVAGEFYPCKPDIFAATYEFAADPDQTEPADEPEDHRHTIQRAVQAIVDERNPDERAFVTGWVLAYESASTTGLNEGYYGGGNITVAQQSPAMSRGLALGCADFYNPTNWGAADTGDDEQ